MFRSFLGYTAILMAEAGAGGGTGTGDGGTGGGGAAPWYGADVAPEVKTLIEAKGFKGVSDVITSYRNLETIIGTPKENILRIPTTAEDKAGWDAVHTRLGRPEKPDGYEFKTPEGGDPKFADWAKATFHGANLTKTQAEAVVTKWNEHLGSTQVEAHNARVNEANQQLAKLKQEWGQNHDGNIKVANQIASALGLDEKSFKAGEMAFGHDGFLKLLHGISTKFGVTLGEADFHLGEGAENAGRMSQSAAQAKLEALKADPEFVKKFAAGDADAKKMWDEVHQSLYPGAKDL